MSSASQPSDHGEKLTIGSLWIGLPWSFLEQLVVQSYLDAGHRFVLFGDKRPSALPSEVEFFDFRKVCTPPFEVGGTAGYHNNGVFSDLFRLVLVRDRGYCWVDMDAYCVKAFDFPRGSWVFAPEAGGLEDPYVANGVLHMPPDSPSLAQAIDVFFQSNPDLSFATERDQANAKAARRAGRPFRIEEATWSVSGPYLLSHFLRLNDELWHALPQSYFYGGIRSRRRPFTRPGVPIDRIEVEGAYSVHFYGRTRRYLLRDHGGLPPAGSYLELLCQRHGIAAKDLPVVP